jgi:hypothetical protein
LRFLHCYLPHLRPARGRARQPRGRIYLMKEMLEGEQKPTPQLVKHIVPLPFLSGLYDDLPFRGALYAPCGPCARLYRREIINVRCPTAHSAGCWPR